MASPRQNRTPALRSSFTEAQRDRQARGKDPYTRGESPSEEEKMRLGAGYVSASLRLSHSIMCVCDVCVLSVC